MKFHICNQAGIVIRVVLVICLLTLLGATIGCKGGDNDSNGSGSNGGIDTQETTDNSAFATMTAVVSEGQLTLNNRWNQSDLAAQNIENTIRWEGKGNLEPVEQMYTHTTLVQDYKQRLQQCEKDALILDVNGNQKCYPELVIDYDGEDDDLFECPAIGLLVRFFILRYGYYCGAGRPNHAAFANGSPEPLDAVDYCCRLHDATAWSDGGKWGGVEGANGENECGIIMCLDQATGTPSNIMDLLPRVEESRQCWYDWAATWCGGNQYDDARAPTLGP